MSHRMDDSTDTVSAVTRSLREGKFEAQVGRIALRERCAYACVCKDCALAKRTCDSSCGHYSPCAERGKRDMDGPHNREVNENACSCVSRAGNVHVQFQLRAIPQMSNYPLGPHQQRQYCQRNRDKPVGLMRSCNKEDQTLPSF